MILDLIERTRTFRRFDQGRTIERAVLEELVNLARLGGSARNCQPWRYGIVTGADECEQIFPLLGWAGYLADWQGPEPGERPSAYVLCFLNREWLKGSDKEAHFDLGIATQNLLLGALEKGIGGCRIGAFSSTLATIVRVDARLELSLVVALGYPAEEVVIEPCREEDIRYWRDDDGVHHVPKRALSDLLTTVEFRR